MPALLYSSHLAGTHCDCGALKAFAKTCISTCSPHILYDKTAFFYQFVEGSIDKYETVYLMVDSMEQATRTDVICVVIDSAVSFERFMIAVLDRQPFQLAIPRPSVDSHALLMTFCSSEHGF